MKIEQVIETGSNIRTGFWEGFSNLIGSDWRAIAIVSIVFAAIIAAVVGLFIKIDNGDSKFIISFLIYFVPLFMIISIAITLAIAIQTKNEVNQKKIETWKTEVAYPYIKSLEQKKSEVIFIKISPELEYSDMYWKFRRVYSINSNPLQPLTISYKTDGVGFKTVTNWYDPSMSLGDDKLPYVQYQHLDKDLPNGVIAGDYYPTVYLPKNYKFTDIK